MEKHYIQANAIVAGRRLRSSVDIEPHPNMTDLFRKKVSELHTLLIDETARQQAVDHIRSKIDHIEIHVGAERGNPEVILVSALAQILAFTQQNKTAASNGSNGRVLMVAGARKPRESLIVPIDL